MPYTESQTLSLRVGRIRVRSAHPLPTHPPQAPQSVALFRRARTQFSTYVRRVYVRALRLFTSCALGLGTCPVYVRAQGRIVRACRRAELARCKRQVRCRIAPSASPADGDRNAELSNAKQIFCAVTVLCCNCGVSLRNKTVGTLAGHENKLLFNRNNYCRPALSQHDTNKLGDSPANLSINHGVMATLQERRLGYHAPAGLEPGTSGFSPLRINHYAARGTTPALCQ
jgi:hypothetical protein